MIIIDLVEEYGHPNPNAPRGRTGVWASWLGLSDPAYDWARQEHIARMNIAREARLATRAIRMGQVVAGSDLSPSSFRAWVGGYARAMTFWL